MKNKSCLIIKNISHENPGLIKELLDEYHIKIDVIDLSKNDKFPDITNFNLVIILGGPDSANDNSEKILNELDFIKQALVEKVPIFGICLGLQLMVKAYGGEVLKNSEQEIGFKHENENWYKIKLTDNGLIDPVFKDIEDNFIVFQLHGDTINLINGITLLGTGEYCENQIIKIGDFNYGFQFHFEITKSLLSSLIEKAPELKNRKNSETILKDFKEINNEFLRRGKKIFKNYLKLIHFV